MVVEAGEVLQFFKASKKRPPTATTSVPGHRPSVYQRLFLASPPPPRPAGPNGGSGLVPCSLLNPAVLTGSPRNPEDLNGKCLINYCHNSSNNSSPAVLGYGCRSAASRAHSPHNFYPRLPDWGKIRPGEGQLKSSGFQRYGYIPFGLPPMALCFWALPLLRTPMQTGILCTLQ